MELRPHQIKAVDMIKRSFKSGRKKPVVAAPCAFGKTHLAAYLMKGCQDKGKRGLFICDRIKLVDQTIDAFDDWGIHYGVIQGEHHCTNYSASVQVASAQTLVRRVKKGYDPKPDLIIVDECHVTIKSVSQLFSRYPNAKIIGLSATPYAKGMGLIYDDLLVPATTQELLDAGYLTPITYYGGAKVDIRGIKTRALSTGGSDFDPRLLEKALTEQGKTLTGSIIQNWLKYGENRQTIAFSPSIAHSKYMVELFRQSGIPAAHIDGYTDIQERIKLFKQHDSGFIKILTCSQLLSVGYDSPTTSCLIDCYPTRSKILFQQRAGRIMRMSPGKQSAIYLDHAGNIERHGLVEWLVPDCLSKDEKRFRESNQIKPKEKKANQCPKCHRVMDTSKCACGFEFKVLKQIETTHELLRRIQGGKATSEDRRYMSRYYSSLLALCRKRGYKDGFAAYLYKSRFDRWPRKIEVDLKKTPLPEAEAWMTSSLIRHKKRKNYDKKTKMVEVA